MNIAISPQLAATIKTPPKIERLRFSSREQWLGYRQKDVTASAAAALLGIHPYQTAYSLWALKTRKISEDVEETPPMRRGKLLEPVAVQCLKEDRPDWQISDHPLGLYFRDPVARIGATPDLFAKDENGKWGVIQIKSIEPGIFRKQWRDADGNITPPLWIVIQAIIECHLTGFEWAAVAPMIVGHGVELPVVPVPLHEGIIDRIKAEVAAFWRIVEEGRVPDADYGRDAALINQLYEPTGAIVDLAQDNLAVELADEKERLAGEAKRVRERQDQVKAELLTKLGGASAGRLSDGRHITATRVNRKAYDVPASSYMDVRIKSLRENRRAS